MSDIFLQFDISISISCKDEEYIYLYTSITLVATHDLSGSIFLLTSLSSSFLSLLCVYRDSLSLSLSRDLFAPDEWCINQRDTNFPVFPHEWIEKSSMEHCDARLRYAGAGEVPGMSSSLNARA